jgi:hypothetical protein
MIKTFNEIISNESIFEGMDVSYLTESELLQAVNVYTKLNESFEKGGIEELEKEIQEGILGTIAGFIMGPAIGKVVANALGIERGILYDMLTSRLVSAALGSAIQNNMK